QGFPASPMRFAENYYLHYPKVAFGHWPPFFYLVDAGWMLLFSESRHSMLALITVLTASVAFVLYKLVARYTAPIYGLWAAVIYLMLPAVLAQMTMLMTEPLLNLTGLLALRSLANHLQSNERSDAIWFGVWASSCIL